MILLNYLEKLKLAQGLVQCLPWQVLCESVSVYLSVSIQKVLVIICDCMKWASLVVSWVMYDLETDELGVGRKGMEVGRWGG